MGASRWDYRIPFQGDVASTFAALQAFLFEGSEHNEHCDTLEDLWADEEFMGTIGTHSILDIYHLAAPDARDALNTLRPLTDAELMAAFDCPRPTLATFLEAADAGRLPEVGRWTGRCAVIYKGGRPDEVAFWGSSGD